MNLEPIAQRVAAQELPSSYAVNPFLYHSTGPAPMGIADYGISGVNTPYTYNTTQFVGIANISSLFVNGINGNSLSFQLNVNLQFNTSGQSYTYWIQNVALLSTNAGGGSGYISFIDNVWNESSSSGNILPSTITGNGIVDTSPGFYYCYASGALPGDNTTITFPSQVEFKVASSETVYQGKSVPAVSFSYNDGFGWQTYDNVLFPFAVQLQSDNGFLVTGFKYNPYGTFYDAELILGGPGGGSNASIVQSLVSLSLERYNGHNFQQISNAYNFGSNTAETILNASASKYFDPLNGGISISLVYGTEYLNQSYSSQEVGYANIFAAEGSGYVYVNGVNTTYFTGGVANITLAPGDYIFEIKNATSGTYSDLSNMSILAGRTTDFPSTYYDAVFTSGNVPLGSFWYVNITGYLSSGRLGSSQTYTISLPNGTYLYTIGVTNKTWYSVSGEFTISGASLNVGIVFKQKQYNVTFDESLSQLPYGSQWYVNLTGGPSSGPVYGSSYTFSLINGTYDYSISVSNKTYKPYPDTNSTFTVNGIEESIPVKFVMVTYEVTFSEFGLPPQSIWAVNANKVLSADAGSNITFYLQNGSYLFSVTAITGGYYVSNNSANSFTVSGKNLNISVQFLPYSYLKGIIVPSDAILLVNGKNISLSAGTFNLSLIPGHYYIEFIASGYLPFYSNVAIGQNTTKFLNVSLQKTPSLFNSSVQEYVVGGGLVISIAGAAFLRRRRK